uniref:Uncharacterized protein n=1 Tax=Aegilops tauschii subsp. strangulata TaxID=200361 RepID=A0A453A6X6_AEGTS
MRLRVKLLILRCSYVCLVGFQATCVYILSKTMKSEGVYLQLIGLRFFNSVYVLVMGLVPTKSIQAHTGRPGIAAVVANSTPQGTLSSCCCRKIFPRQTSHEYPNTRR